MAPAPWPVRTPGSRAAASPLPESTFDPSAAGSSAPRAALELPASGRAGDVLAQADERARVRAEGVEPAAVVEKSSSHPRKSVVYGRASPMIGAAALNALAL